MFGLECRGKKIVGRDFTRTSFLSLYTVPYTIVVFFWVTMKKYNNFYNNCLFFVFETQVFY